MGGYIKSRARGALVLIFCALVFAGVFSLFGVPWQAAAYAGALCLAALVALAVPDYQRYRSRRAALRSTLEEISLSLDRLPVPVDPVEADYQALLRAAYADARRKLSEADARMDSVTEYYTIWAHQIKTPIAAMRLLLQEPSLDASALAAELFRVERYVEMSLCYLRLGSESTDYLLCECDLDAVIKQALRKYAPQFIRGKVRLAYQPVNAKALTDEKWLCFVIEQIISNAIKYAPGGEVKIALEKPLTLVISDDGIGIAPEDLPRVFEKGYTGLNGRLDKRATGIGLYLCRQIMRRLGHGIRISSRPGVGTAVRLDLDVTPLKRE